MIILFYRNLEMSRNKGVRVPIYFSETLMEAATQHAASRGENLSEMIRRVVAGEVGRPELGKPVPIGRPPGSVSRPASGAKSASVTQSGSKKVATAASGKKVTAAKKAAKKTAE